MDQISELINIIKKLEKRVDSFEKQLAEQKKYTESVILNNTAHLNQISNNIDVKLDVLTNVSSGPESKPTPKKTKAVTKATYFKTIFKEDLQKYVGILYSEDEIEELYDNDEVKSKKTDTQKKNQVISLLYTKLGKDVDKTEKMKVIYEDYKKAIEDDEE